MKRKFFVLLSILLFIQYASVEPQQYLLKKYGEFRDTKKLIENLDAKDIEIFNNFHAVVEGEIYRSGQLTLPMLARCVEQYGIRTVINLREKAEDLDIWRLEHSYALAEGLLFLSIPFSSKENDSFNEYERLVEAFRKIEYPALIHCKKGKNRTSEACALWLLTVKGVNVTIAGRQFSVRYGYRYGKKPARRNRFENYCVSKK